MICKIYNVNIFGHIRDRESCCYNEGMSAKTNLMRLFVTMVMNFTTDLFSHIIYWFLTMITAHTSTIVDAKNC